MSGQCARTGQCKCMYVIEINVFLTKIIFNHDYKTTNSLHIITLQINS